MVVALYTANAVGAMVKVCKGLLLQNPSPCFGFTGGVRHLFPMV